MNTGFLGPAVATVLTACGIETLHPFLIVHPLYREVLQQYLPLAVLKPKLMEAYSIIFTSRCNSTYRLRY